MRRLGLALLTAGLAGCAAQPAPDAAEATRAAQAQACAAAVAKHVGKDTGAVTASLDHETPEGTTVFVVTDAQAAGGERTHTCEADASARVLAILHPGT